MNIAPVMKSVLVVGTLGTVLGIGGYAVAAFVQNTTTGPVAGSAEAFSAVTVTGAQTGTLLPGETASVTLTLTNPNANVKAKLISVVPGEVVVDTVADTADKTYCQEQIELSTAGADAVFPTLAVSEANYPFKLTDAVKLAADTDIRCGTMTFHTTWTAQFQAVR